MKSLVWISFDLGIRGDYNGLYAFLDDHAAKECADNCAVIEFEYRKDLLTELTKALREAVTVDKKSRIYAIAKNSTGTYSGKFIIGKRKSPLWAGYGSAAIEQEADVDE